MDREPSDAHDLIERARRDEFMHRVADGDAARLGDPRMPVEHLERAQTRDIHQRVGIHRDVLDETQSFRARPDVMEGVGVGIHAGRERARERLRLGRNGIEHRRHQFRFGLVALDRESTDIRRRQIAHAVVGHDAHPLWAVLPCVRINHPDLAEMPAIGNPRQRIREDHLNRRAVGPAGTTVRMPR